MPSVITGYPQRFCAQSNVDRAFFRARSSQSRCIEWFVFTGVPDRANSVRSASLLVIDLPSVCIWFVGDQNKAIAHAKQFAELRCNTQPQLLCWIGARPQIARTRARLKPSNFLSHKPCFFGADGQSVRRKSPQMPRHIVDGTPRLAEKPAFCLNNLLNESPGVRGCHHEQASGPQDSK